MYYRMHEIESDPEISDDDDEGYDNYEGFEFEEADEASETSQSSNNKQTNDGSHKIRKNFPETWLWNSTITGYAMQ
jgi:hypothetical protein